MQNLAGAKIICEQLGVKTDDFYKSISSYKLPHRRLQIISDKKNLLSDKQKNEIIKLLSNFSYSSITISFFGLLGRDLLIITTVDAWNIIIFSELFFGIFIALGFLLHTLGFAQWGIILSCVAGIGSATAFNFLIGWSTFFHLWYINLAILIIAVPLKTWFKLSLALSFIGVYCLFYLLFSQVGLCLLRQRIQFAVVPTTHLMPLKPLSLKDLMMEGSQ